MGCLQRPCSRVFRFKHTYEEIACGEWQPYHGSKCSGRAGDHFGTFARKTAVSLKCRICLRPFLSIGQRKAYISACPSHVNFLRTCRIGGIYGHQFHKFVVSTALCGSLYPHIFKAVFQGYRIVMFGNHLINLRPFAVFGCNRIFLLLAEVAHSAACRVDSGTRRDGKFRCERCHIDIVSHNKRNRMIICAVLDLCGAHQISFGQRGALNVTLSIERLFLYAR